MVVSLVGVVVGPHAAVPVGSKQHTSDFGGTLAGIHCGDDVLAAHLGTVPQHGRKVLHNHRVAPTAHMLCQIVGTTALSLAAGCAVAACHLCRHKGVSAVGIESGGLDFSVIDG